MVQTTDDGILKQDMPPALTKVESAAKLLEEAATLSQIDPLSSTARQKLIEGSRWILQGILKSYYWLGDYYIDLTNSSNFLRKSTYVLCTCHILGTSSVLMVFDESEVRKIIVDCKKVLDYLAVAEVIESIEDLVQFVRDLSPCLSKVSRCSNLSINI